MVILTVYKAAIDGKREQILNLSVGNMHAAKGIMRDTYDRAERSRYQATIEDTDGVICIKPWGMQAFYTLTHHLSY